MIFILLYYLPLYNNKTFLLCVGHFENKGVIKLLILIWKISREMKKSILL